MTLTPAYSRTYKSQAEVLADFNNEKDFIRQDFASPELLINKPQIARGTFIQFRFGKGLEKTFGYHVK